MTTAIAEAEVVGVRQLMKNPPAKVLEEASLAAKSLQDVLNQKKTKVMMGGEQYLEFEDWQTLGRFYNVTAKEDGDPEFVQFGDISRFKASSVALDADGNVISRATGFCMSDEEKWGSRPKYAYAYVLLDGEISIEEPPNVWKTCQLEDTTKKREDGTFVQKPKKARVLVGDERVPLFQLASMAQTRANAKVLRNVLSWVAVLAGYKPTPAEELQDTTSETSETAKATTPKKEPKKEPAKESAKAPAKEPVKEPDKSTINEKLAEHELRILDELLGKAKADVKRFCAAFDISKPEELPKSQYVTALAQLRKKITQNEEAAAKEAEKARIEAEAAAKKAAASAPPPAVAPPFGAKEEIPW